MLSKFILKYSHIQIKIINFYKKMLMTLISFLTTVKNYAKNNNFYKKMAH